MKRIASPIAYILTAIVAVGCAKHIATGPNEANKRYFDAWLEVNGIDVEPSGLGIYVLEQTEGTGIEVHEDGMVLMDYTVTDLNGKITSFTDAVTAQQLGKYKPQYYYGPKFTSTYQDNIYAGVADMLYGMKVGGTKKAIIPNWLFSYKEFDTEEEYLELDNTMESLIYDVKIKDFTTDIQQWEIDSIGRFFLNDKVLIDGLPADQVFVKKENGVTVPMTVNDTTQVNGFYYKQLKAPVTDESFNKDTTIYINYTGKLLNGQVFDTTDEMVAKQNNIYSASRSYEPMQINWINEDDETYKDITMGSDSGSIIEGFALTLWQMKAMEKGVGIFYSPLGYNKAGSGDLIPGYAPLIFEIEIVAKPEV